MANGTLESIGLALQGFGAGVGGQLPQFQAGLAQRQQASTKAAQLQDQQIKQARASDIIQARGALQRGDVQGASDIFGSRVQSLDESGIDSANSLAAFNAISGANTPELVANVISEFDDDLLDLVAGGTIDASLLKSLGIGGARAGLASAKTEILSDGSVVQALPSGEVQVRNPQGQIVTGQARLDTIRNAREQGIAIKQEVSDIAVTEARGKAEATQRAKRVSDITTELSTRSREAKRADINLAQAATLVERAQQGATGASKLRLAKLFPGIDVSNEAALSQSLTNLALDQLQKFKGPTTDFEFGKTEEIAGTLGDSKTANRAKVASLQRANWFTQRESQQFREHIKAGKNPDTFGFDFGEQIKTKKGNFSLQDLQDTAVSNNISIKETIKRLNK